MRKIIQPYGESHAVWYFRTPDEVKELLIERFDDQLVRDLTTTVIFYQGALKRAYVEASQGQIAIETAFALIDALQDGSMIEGPGDWIIEDL